MRIHVAYTGGTIGMIHSPEGLLPGADVQGWLSNVLEGTQIDPEQVSFTTFDPLIDSSNATPAHWQLIIDDLIAHWEKADAFVVLHGTDTMSYAASALSYALTGFGKPVIVTGSQHPLGVVESDAIANVTGALNAAISGKATGVTLFFGHHLFAGNRVTKFSSWAFEGFTSPSTGPLARTGTPWHWYASPIPATGWPNPKPYVRQDIAVLDLVPGISAERLRAMLDPAPSAVLVRAYGVGNVPDEEPGLARVVIDLINNGTPVIISSQCLQAEVILGRYAASSPLVKAGAIGTGDMTLEAAYTKLVFLLSQGLQGDELRHWMATPIAGELSLH